MTTLLFIMIALLSPPRMDSGEDHTEKSVRQIMAPERIQPSSSSAKLFLSGAPNVRLDLRVDSFGDGVAVAENDDTLLTWTKAKKKAKITVSTFCPGQRFDLSVQALRLKNGKGAGTIALVDGMNDMDLIVGIKGKKTGSATIMYQTQVSIEEGHSEDDFGDTHTVSFTMTNQ